MAVLPKMYMLYSFSYSLLVGTVNFSIHVLIPYLDHNLDNMFLTMLITTMSKLWKILLVID
jgi:hypothetical protein